MAQHKAYDVPEHGTDRWKIARAKRAARLKDFEDDDDDLDWNDFLCPGDVIQYRIHPDPQWYFDTIVSTDPERDRFMVHCCNSKIHDDAMVGVIATKDNAGHFVDFKQSINARIATLEDDVKGLHQSMNSGFASILQAIQGGKGSK
jgi:hypothetical protein